MDVAPERTAGKGEGMEQAPGRKSEAACRLKGDAMRMGMPCKSQKKSTQPRGGSVDVIVDSGRAALAVRSVLICNALRGGDAVGCVA
jgi:hypothetical protein